MEFIVSNFITWLVATLVSAIALMGYLFFSKDCLYEFLDDNSMIKESDSAFIGFLKMTWHFKMLLVLECSLFVFALLTQVAIYTEMF